MSQFFRTTFQSLFISGYRRLWLSDIALNWAEFVEMIVLSWYILQETGSPTLLGLYGALRFTGTLAAPFFGVFVDRFGRRKTLYFSRISFLVLSSSVLLFAVIGYLSIIPILLVSSLVGLSRSLDMIVRQSIIPEIVGVDRITNGVALSRIGRDITQITGPIFGGLLLESMGLSFSYVAVVAFYLYSLFLVLSISGIPDHVTETKLSAWRNLKDGLVYVKRNELVFGLLLVAFVVNLTAFPFNNASLVVLAKEVINTSASGLGWLMGCYSFGALLGSLLIGARNSDIETGKITFVAAIGWHMGIIVMSKITWFTPSLPVLAFTGMMQSLSMVTMAMMILKFVTPEMRGRILGLRQLSVYGLPLGLLCTGFISEEYGVAVSLVTSGVVGLALLAFVAVKWPRIIKGSQKPLDQVI